MVGGLDEGWSVGCGESACIGSAWRMDGSIGREGCCMRGALHRAFARMAQVLMCVGRVRDARFAFDASICALEATGLGRPQ